MKFLAHHPLLVVLGIAGGFCLARGLDRLSRQEESSERLRAVFESKKIISSAALIFGVFLFWAYGRPKAYYFPWNAGVLGDNYLYMAHSVTRDLRDYYTPQHISYPWLPGKIILLAEKIGVLSRLEPMFLESAFAMSTLVNRMAMLAALSFFAWGLWVGGLNPWDVILGTFFMAACEGCWLWGHQSNALGICIAAQIVTSAVFLIWYKRQRLIDTAGLGLAMTLCVYAHIGALYFSIGGYLSTIYLIAKSEQLDPGKKFPHLCVFHATILFMASAYYWLASRYVGSCDPRVIFRSLADTGYYGDYGFHLNQIPKYVKDNLVGSLMNIVNYWDPKTPWEAGLILSQCLLLSAIGVLTFAKFKRGFNQFFRTQLIFFTFASLSTFLGFSMRNAASHYYVVATVPNAGMFLFLLLPVSITSTQVFQKRILLLSMIFTMVLYSGFSHMNVFEGSRLDENEYYRASRVIYETLSPGQKAIYFRQFEFDYPNGAVRNYYKPKFGRIDWRTNPLDWANPAQLLNHLKELLAHEQIKIFTSDNVSEALPSHDALEIQHLAADVNLLKKI
jgi:hypothetical protein